ncbi:hypothetical protein AGMMS50229_13780 [Campylobacterota bacterium]|nr:hypothetical protein AGMMS50229_13780 [Campylobacterota bacterium]
MQEKVKFVEVGNDQESPKRPWKILVVDEDPDVHSVAKMVLTHVSFDGRALELMSAFNAIEAKQLVAFHSNVAVIFLDATIESENAAIELIRFVRDDLKNSAVRIIYRAMQQGMLPESQMVSEYNINDYKTSATLSSQMLFTSVITALRGFRDMYATHATKNALELVAFVLQKLIHCQSLDSLLHESINQLGVLLYMERSTYYTPLNGLAVVPVDDVMKIAASVGDYEGSDGKTIGETLKPSQLQHFTNAYEHKTHYISQSFICLIVDPNKFPPCAIVAQPHRELEEWEKSVITIFAANLSALYRALLSKSS